MNKAQQEAAATLGVPQEVTMCERCGDPIRAATAVARDGNGVEAMSVDAAPVELLLPSGWPFILGAEEG